MVIFTCEDLHAFPSLLKQEVALNGAIICQEVENFKQVE